jgi:Flp pilus assembly protein TadB
MNLKEAIILSLSAALLIIAIHLTMVDGITLSYPVFMAAVALLFLFKYLQNKRVDQEKISQMPKHKKPKDRIRK